MGVAVYRQAMPYQTGKGKSKMSHERSGKGGKYESKGFRMDTKGKGKKGKERRTTKEASSDGAQK